MQPRDAGHAAHRAGLGFSPHSGYTMPPNTSGKMQLTGSSATSFAVNCYSGCGVRGVGRMAGTGGTMSAAVGMIIAGGRFLDLS
jgi:hypothetical protein